jgi:membrane protein DedA with SNARE-associated domain
MYTIIQIILIIILSGFVIYWIGRIFAKGFFDEVEKKLIQKLNNRKFKTKDNERKEE